MSIKDRENKGLSKEDIDRVRGIEGFPIGNDEDIQLLSDKPYFTLCPNMYINDWLKEQKKDVEMDLNYDVKPFAADVREGKGDAIYNAHSYHTKVPYKAIVKYILHYTKPGDIVFDGFSGTGMTGVAAQKCDGEDIHIRASVEKDMPDVSWGSRKAILSDLSPIAAFISANYNKKYDIDRFEEEALAILEKFEDKYGWMYKTKHLEKNTSQGSFLNNDELYEINSMIWSDVFICNNCSNEIIFWDEAADKEKKKISSSFTCPKCNAELEKKNCANAEKLIYDEVLDKTLSVSKTVPVEIQYTVGTTRHHKKLDSYDFEVLKKIENTKIPFWFPTNRMCNGVESRRNDKYGITHVHHFFTKRNLLALSFIYEEILKSELKMELLFIFTSILQRSNKTNRFNYKGTGGLSGTLYIPSLVFERNITNIFRKKINDIIKAKRGIHGENVFVSQASLTSIPNVLDKSIDYIFIDPPFGSNLYYSELSYIWESWIKVFTNNNVEAIVNTRMGKNLTEYQELMTKCFNECYRILKPGRWMTIEFSNSKNAVWIAIQEALNRAGFVIADVKSLDKIQGSFKQVTTTTAVKQDLVISAYKPTSEFTTKIIQHKGTSETVWDFVKEYLQKIDIITVKDKSVELIREREAYALYDKVIAFHVMNNIALPLDVIDFNKGLSERFLERDNMYFLHDQVNAYDKACLIYDVEPIQFSLFIHDERTAISWLYYILEKPKTYAEIQPQFMQALKLEKHELLPELNYLLEENFLINDYGKWYIPDRTKEGDLIRLREKRLRKEFDRYLIGKEKLKLFRTEAIRLGFAKLWKDKNYKDVVRVADRLPSKVVQEDDKLLMYYDISLSRLE